MKQTGESRDLRAMPQNGIALIMVLWILTILMVIALSFTTMTRTETLASVSFRQGVEKKFLAEAGIERGIMELIYRSKNKGQTVVLEGMELWGIDGSPHTVQLDNGAVTVRILDESGKVDINRTPEVILRNLLGNLGIAMEDVDIIADSIMDWRDADDLHRLHGAEDDYYSSLPTPYKTKNADFETVEELLLVRGVTPEILYGNGEKKGIFEFLTVHGKNDRININAAPREVLIAAGVSEDILPAILEARKTRYITGLQEFGLPAESQRYVSSGEGSSFAIEATGHKASEKRGYTIRATVSLDDKNLYRYLSYKSPADVTYE